MKRRMALLLAMLLLLSVFVACKPSEGQTHKPGQGDLTDAGYQDFGGKEVVYLCEANSESYVHPKLGTGDQWSDTILDHLERIESDMNVKFRFESEQGGTLVTRLQAMAISGANEGDIVLADGASLITLYPTGIFADINTLSAIDLSDEDKYGPESIRKFAEYHGKLYSLYQTGSITWPGAPFNIFNAILINDNLVEDMNADHPVEMYEQGTWTFNNFTNYVQSVTNTDPTNYVYGLDASWFGHIIIPQSALYANGCPPVVEDATGKFTFGYTSSSAARALEWAKNLYAMRDNVAREAPADNSASSYFVTGNATMYLGHSYYLTSLGTDIQQNIESLSFVTFPYGEDVTYGSVSTAFYDTPIATSIIRNGDEEDTAVILSHFLDPMVGNMNGEYNEYLRSYCFPDDNDSYGIYMEAGRNAAYEYTAQLSAVYSDITGALEAITKGERSVTEAITGITNRVNAEIDTQFN